MGLAVLKHRPLRRFMLGHLASSVGTRMAMAAYLWHIYEMTRSPIALGTLGVVQLAPMLGLTVLGGVAADRLDRRTLLMATQLCQALPALGLAWLTLTNQVTPVLLFLAAGAIAAAEAFDTSTRKALVPNLVPNEDLAPALALADLTKNGAKLAGPALMGWMTASMGIGWVYVTNGLSFCLMLAALLTLAPMPTSGPQSEALWNQIKAGARFIKDSQVIWGLTILDFLANLFASAMALLPMYAVEVLGLEADGYGMLASSAALGAFIGSTVLLVRPPTHHLGRWVVGSAALFGAGTIGLGLSTTIVAAFGSLAVVGAADTVSTVLRNTLRQVLTPDHLRGRVTSLSMLFTKSGPRLGELEAGLVAAAFGVQASIVSGGILCVLSAGGVLWRYEILRQKTFETT